MGSLLGPLFAYFFMDSFEKKIMPKLEELGVKCWLRYVYDTFVVLKNKTKLSLILETLNSQQPRIKLTYEEESNNRLPFLDVQVTKKNSKLPTTIYRKPTFTELYLRWTSLTSIK